MKISKDAPEKEIKRSYHEWARKLHPDKASSLAQQQEFEAEFALISKAYSILKDSERRKEYDATLREEKEKAQVAQAEGKPAALAAPSAGVGRAVDAGRANIAQRAYVKGMQLFQVGDYARATEFFDAAIKNNPNEAPYYIKLATSLMRSKRSFNRAVECAQKACELDSYNLDYKLALAEIYETAGSRSLAIKQVEEVLKWDATHAKAQLRLAALQDSGDRSFFAKILAKFRN